MAKDPTPHGGEAFHELPDRAKIPQPKPGGGDDAPLMAPDSKPLHGGEETRDTAQAQQPAVGERPPLPERTQQLAADIEDEEADPVKESGPGVADEPKELSVTQQPVR